MKIVCDTNVLVSGILFGGNPREILRLCSAGKVINFISPEMMQEVDFIQRAPTTSHLPGQNHSWYGANHP